MVFIFGLVLKSLLLCATGGATPATLTFEEPFYRKKTELWKKVDEDREILVSARAGENPDWKLGDSGSKKQRLAVSAGGMVGAPFPFSVKTITQYDKLHDVDDRFQSSHFNKEKSELALDLAVYGYHAAMTLKLNVLTREGVHLIQFESIGGSFVGMAGVIELKDHKRQRTEISMTAQYTSAKLPLPDILMGFGLEVVAQRVAGVMRSYIEGEYKREFKSSL